MSEQHKKKQFDIDPAVSCTGKVAFDTRTLAAAVLNRPQTRGTKKRPSRSVYRCVHCQLWHIGSDLGKPKRELRHD